MYKLIKTTLNGEITTTVWRVADCACIPVDLANMDYQNYLAWVAEGNTPIVVNT
jgi:hypothetical protein